MKKKIPSIILLLLGFSFVTYSGFSAYFSSYSPDSSFFVQPAYAANFNSEQTDDYCEDNLEGSSSKESCITACTTPGFQCFLARKFLASQDPDLSKDVECFGCRKPICEDFGKLGAAGKTRCDAQPDHQSVAAAPLPDGTPCWTCELKPDECKDKWPGTTAKAACEASCNDPAKLCARLGNYKGVDCFACVPKVNPKPPKTCNDLGAITNAQCGTCADPTPNCVPAGFRDQTGRICFQCAPKPKACVDIGKTNASICNGCRANGGKCIADGRAPNGELCYTCEDRKCKDIGKEDRSICAQCRADGNRCIPDGRSPSGEQCYQCKILKNCKDQGKTNKDVCATCSEDEACRYVSSAENGERCYRCKPKPKETCKDKGLLTDWDCETCEDDPDTKCVEAGKTRDGEQCYKCVDKTGCEKEDIPKGGCPADCSEGQKCVPQTVDGEECHECAAKTCSDFGLKESCEKSERCDPSTPAGELQCCDCQPNTCESHGLKKNCDAETEICQETSAGDLSCCDCRKKNCADIKKDSQESCSSCEQEGNICQPAGSAPNGEACYQCQPKPAPKKTCQDLGYDGDFDECMAVCAEKGACERDGRNDDYDKPCWKCKPKKSGVTDTGDGGNPIFSDGFESGDTSAWSTEDSSRPQTTTGERMPGLVIGDRAAIKDEFCDEEMDGYASRTCLGDCPPQNCVSAGTVLVNGLGLVTCYYCTDIPDTRPIIRLPDGRIARINSIEVTYIIIIIETPRGRVILDKNKGALEDFEPAVIMALSQYDESMGPLEKLLGPSPDAKGNIEEIAGKLNNTLSSQRSAFSEKAFDDFAVKTPQESEPSSDKFGSTDADALPLSGPIIAAGKIKGKPVFAVFSSGGALVGTVGKDDLKENPNILVEKLVLAGDLSLRYTESPVQSKVEYTDTASMARSYKASKNKKKEGELVEPNDPLFEVTKKKKKKLLGVFGSSSGAAPVVIGSGMKIGGRTMGGGSLRTGGNSSKVNDQWGLQEVGYLPKSDEESAWNVIDGSKVNTVVAVIDSGFDMTHPDGPQYLWKNPGEIADNGVDDDNNGFIDDVNGWNFLEDNNDLTDLKGHGTFVAGIIAAKTNNGIGIAGINPGAVIMPLRVADKVGNTNSLNITRAIQYAVVNGAKVINISLGGRGISQLEQMAINNAHSRGVFVSISSGNVGEDLTGHGPASAHNAFAVGATDIEGTRSVISNWGPNNGLLAPGEDIYSIHSKDAPWEGGSADRDRLYYTQSGTSFSSPIVAGTAALMLAKNPKLTPGQIEDILSATAVDMDDEGWDGSTGAGLLNAAAALRAEPKGLLTVKIIQLRVNRDESSKRNQKFLSLDVFATVRGDFDQFTVEIGKGKRASSFEKVAGPFKSEADYSWVAHIDKDQMRGSDDWIIRINATDKKGNPYIAQSFLKLSE